MLSWTCWISWCFHLKAPFPKVYPQRSLLPVIVPTNILYELHTVSARAARHARPITITWKESVYKPYANFRVSTLVILLKDILLEVTWNLHLSQLVKRRVSVRACVVAGRYSKHVCASFNDCEQRFSKHSTKFLKKLNDPGFTRGNRLNTSTVF